MERVELFPSKGLLIVKVLVGAALVALGVCVTFGIDLGLSAASAANFTADELVTLQTIAAAVTLLLCWPLGATLEALIWPSPVVTTGKDGITLKGNHISWADYRGLKTRTTRVNFIKVGTSVKVLTHSRRWIFWRSHTLDQSWMPKGGSKAVTDQIQRAAAFYSAGEGRAPRPQRVTPKRKASSAPRPVRSVAAA